MNYATTTARPEELAATRKAYLSSCLIDLFFLSCFFKLEQLQRGRESSPGQPGGCGGTVSPPCRHQSQGVSPQSRELFHRYQHVLGTLMLVLVEQEPGNISKSEGNHFWCSWRVSWTWRGEGDSAQVPDRSQAVGTRHNIRPHVGTSATIHYHVVSIVSLSIHLHFPLINSTICSFIYLPSRPLNQPCLPSPSMHERRTPWSPPHPRPPGL